MQQDTNYYKSHSYLMLLQAPKILRKTCKSPSRFPYAALQLTYVSIQLKANRTACHYYHYYYEANNFFDDGPIAPKYSNTKGEKLTAGATVLPFLAAFSMDGHSQRNQGRILLKGMDDSNIDNGVLPTKCRGVNVEVRDVAVVRVEVVDSGTERREARAMFARQEVMALWRGIHNPKEPSWRWLHWVLETGCRD